MNKQDFYRQKYKEIYPGWKDSQTLYADYIKKYTMSKSKILDIGCGHSTFLKDIYSLTPYTYGIDPDQSAIQKNTIIKNKYVGVAELLPFENNFFDIVVSAWVMEHLKNPEVVFKEIYRVLKPGGKVIFLTPNVFNYNVWIIRLIPEIFHDFLNRKLYDRQEHDTFKKFYRINSVDKINSISKNTGFKNVNIILNGDPTYISFNESLFRFACFLESIINRCPASKVHLIGILEKVS